MVIASRTPEGSPNRCPVCNNEVKIDPSKPTLDAPCPHCGHLLWFTADKLTVRQVMVQSVLRIITARFGEPLPAVRKAIEAVVEPEQLKKILDRAASARRQEEIFSNP